MHRALRRTLAPVAALALLAVAPAAAPAACPGAGVVPGPGNFDRARTATLCLLNEQRKRRGLDPLRDDRKLRRAAEAFSREMVQHGFFDHRSAVDGSTMESRVRATGYLDGARGWRLGENIAWGSGPLATPRRIVRGWMRSPGHRSNILQKGFEEIGIGIAAGAPQQGVDGGATYTTDFGARS